MTAPRRALVVVDVQQEYFDGPLAIQYPPVDRSLANITRAMDAAADLDMPVVVVQHEAPEGAAVFAAGSAGWELHPDVVQRVRPAWKRVAKSAGSVFAGTDVGEWLHAQGVDTISIVGYMTNNCDIATAVEAEGRGIAAEVLSDATGAIHLSNQAGSASAEQVHRTLMTLLHSNFAAVADTKTWIAAATGGQALATSDLGTSATDGRKQFGADPS
jgi:nicotinamidase-related amidase